MIKISRYTTLTGNLSPFTNALEFSFLTLDNFLYVFGVSRIHYKTFRYIVEASDKYIYSNMDTPLSKHPCKIGVCVCGGSGQRITMF